MLCPPANTPTIPAVTRSVMDFGVLEGAFAADCEAITAFLREDTLPLLHAALDALQESVLKENRLGAERLAQRLRGSAATIGAGGLALAMGRLSRAIATEDWLDATCALISARDVIERLSRWIAEAA
jgi:hypothetical protein